MAGNSNGKLRTLAIMRMLQDETDETHGLSMTAIIQKLEAEWGLTADRKTIYTDLDTLRDFGLTIDTFQRNPVEYAIVHRDFTLEELMLMVDAVQSCRFITQKQSEKISRNLKLLATDNQREKLNRCIHVDGRVRGRNDAVLGNVDAIHDAMRQKSKVQFTYWKIGADGEWHIQHEGKPYELTPMRVTFSESYYYLTAWSDSHNAPTEYRIDRMRDVRVSSERATRCQEISDYEYQARDSQYFGRFDGELVNVVLKVEEELMPAVWDRFGKDADISQKKEDGPSTVRVDVRVSPQFFGWVAGLDGKVSIAKPKKLAKQYRDYLKKLLEK